MNIKKQIRSIENFFFYYVLQKELFGCKSVLDVGCGHSSSIGEIRKSFFSEGIDIYKNNIVESKRKKLHDRYTLGDIKKLSKLYKPKSFDACVAIDVIEHFSRKDAFKLMKDMETIARKKVILLTPNGYYEQDDYDGNPYQVHKSGWVKNDFERLKYRVSGLRGLQVLRDDHASIRFKPWLFWGFCSFISEFIFYPFPSLSFDLFAVKKME